MQERLLKKRGESLFVPILDLRSDMSSERSLESEWPEQPMALSRHCKITLKGGSSSVGTRGSP